jgi:hypothetical protein
MSQTEYLFCKMEQEEKVEVIKPDQKTRNLKGHTLTHWVENVSKQVYYGESLFGDVPEEKKLPSSNNPIMPDKIQSKYSSAYIKRAPISLVTSNNDSLFDHQDVTEIIEPPREMTEEPLKKLKNNGIIAHEETLFEHSANSNKDEDVIYESVEE